MSKSNLVESVNIRINLDDMKILREQANKRRMPVSTLCREKITKDIESYV
jgi:predicted DNA binding CopG/RHH family protein|tara:strand:+ start:285 stop:434 length:150 start_codon:yes stop_codon:yes gene_type:complete